MTEYEKVKHPEHYNSHPGGVECITVARHHTFNIGSVFKYLWRAGIKPDESYLEALLKAQEFLKNEIALETRRERERNKDGSSL